MNLAGQRLGLLGFGVENRALGAWLRQQHLPFTVCDTNPQAGARTDWDGRAVDWRLGADAFSALTDFDVLFRSPGIPLQRPELVAAQRAGVRLSSGVDLFLQRCPAPVTGVTGTKGKGTTSSWLVSILQADGVPVRLGGNIGIPPVSFLDELTPQDCVVLELSSFQLQHLGRSPQGAVLLPVHSDHLDYHTSRQEYVEAKGEICRHQGTRDWVLADVTDDTACRLARGSAARQLGFAGIGAFNGDGTWAHGKQIWWRQGCTEVAIAGVEDVHLPGAHNLGNACAAAAAALLMGASPAAVPGGLRAFSGLPHRLQRVAERDGVLYVNDSLATTPEAATAGLLSWPERRVVLIAGGSSKGANHAGLGAAIAAHAHALVTMGEEGPAIERAARLAGFSGGSAQDCTSMEEAVRAAAQYAARGDVVLLSPGCASFGMFSDYAERGEAFCRAVLD